MALSKKVYRLTQAGKLELEAELAELKLRRLKVAVRLKEAKEQLDLTENSDWADAQDESKYVEGRLNEIDYILRNLQIIKPPRKPSAVELGCAVELTHDGKKIKYTLVGSLEANPEARKISEESPLGKALLGKKVGETVEISTSAGDTTYVVSKIG